MGLYHLSYKSTNSLALVIFKEKVSGKLWAAIGLITLSSILLSFGVMLAGTVFVVADTMVKSE